jgi:3-oxoacyl-[acyl-carrier-protein] synthase III
MAFTENEDRTTTWIFGAGPGAVTVQHQYDTTGAGHRLVVGASEGDVAPATRLAASGAYRGVHESFAKTLGDALPEVFKVTEGVLD